MDCKFKEKFECSTFKTYFKLEVIKWCQLTAVLIKNSKTTKYGKMYKVDIDHIAICIQRIYDLYNYYCEIDKDYFTEEYQTLLEMCKHKSANEAIQFLNLLLEDYTNINFIE